MTTNAKLPLVWFIGTGGTIASSGGLRTTFAGYGGGPPRDVMANLERVPEIQQYVRTKAEQYGQLGFPSPTDSLKISRRINQLAKDPDVAGFVVTHGTAIMEETAYYLNLLVKTDKPVIITGSMRPPQAMGTDADNNLLGAAILAGSQQAKGKGVLLMLNDEINAARDVTKTNSYRLETFQSREIGLLGYMDSDMKAIFYRLPVKKHTFQTEFDPDKITEPLPWVEMVICAPGTNGKVIRWIADQGCPGIVWGGAGAGGGPGEAMEALTYAAQKGTKVVISTRGGAGRVIKTKNYVDRNWITADNLLPYKATTLLQLGLTKTKDNEELQRMFESY